MKKLALIFTESILLAAGLPFNNIVSLAQEAPKAAAEAKSVAETQPQSVYRLDFVVRELEGDRKINSRSYSMSARNNDWGRIRVGSSIPVKTGENTFQYKDVGINIDCRLEERESGAMLNTTFESSSLAAPEEKIANPVLRQVRLSEESLVTAGKPTVIGKLDDVATNHRFEIEVTATKVR